MATLSYSAAVSTLLELFFMTLLYVDLLILPTTNCLQCADLFNIKESFKGLFHGWWSYRCNFPTSFDCSPSSPEYLILFFVDERDERGL